MRKNRVGGAAKIWRFENKGKYSVAEMSYSKKFKDGDYLQGTLVNGYDLQWQSKFVRLVGQAHKFINEAEIPSGGLWVRLLNYDVTNKYDREAGKEYTNYTVYSLEKLPPYNGQSNNATETEKAQSPKSDPDLPF